MTITFYTKPQGVANQVMDFLNNKPGPQPYSPRSVPGVPLGTGWVEAPPSGFTPYRRGGSGD